MRKFLVIILLVLCFGNITVAQFPTKTNLSNLTISTNTREKPQAKAWKHDGKHWTVQSDDDGAHIWRLDGTSWTRILTISSKSNLRADCKVDGNLVHIFLFRENKSVLVSAEYIPSNGTYKLWTQRTATVSVSTDSDAETATIDIDTNNRMWMAYDTDTDIMVRWSDPPYSAWSSPISVASNIDDDDIGAVVAFPMFNKIGVFWSNQNTERWGFKMHTDGASPATWSSDENPASQSAQNKGNGFSDDHLNLKVASDGTLYCAVKTGYDSPGYTKISLLVRRPNGAWDNIYKVSEMGTRGIVLLNETAGKIRVIYTETEDGGDIYYRESNMSPISFGQEFTLISGNYNNATSIKNNYTSDVVILASTSSTAASVLVSDGTTSLPLPGIPTPASPANNATGIANPAALSWNAASNSASYQVQVSTNNSFSSLVADVSNITTLNTTINGLAYNTQYFWRTRAVNATGAGNWSAARNFTTETEPIVVPGIPTLASPANNSSGIAINPALSWNTAANATSYQLQVAATNTFSSPVADESNITTLSRQVSGLSNNTQYFWRVRAFNGSTEGSWSSVRNFTTVSAPVSLPDVPVLASPADNANGIALSPALSWNAAANATTYQVQVATSNTFSAPVENISNITALNTSVSGLVYSTQYFWRVKAINTAGESNWSAVRNFTTVAQPVTPANGLVAHWEMENNTGGTLTDATANANHASTSGSPTLVSGVYGQALQLNGSNQYASVPSNASLDITNAITLAAWIKPESSGSRQYILKKGHSTDGYELSLTGSRRIAFRFNQESGDSEFATNSTMLHPTDGNTWMHIAATFDGTTMNVYVNGNLDKSETVSPAASINSNNQPLGIGATGTGSSRFQGALDDVRIYNVVLSASDISSLAAMPSARMAATTQPDSNTLQTANLQATPNPFTSETKIRFVMPDTGGYSVILYNTAGLPVKAIKEGTAEAGQQLELHLKNTILQPGLYMLRLQTGKTSQNLKLMLTR